MTLRNITAEDYSAFLALFQALDDFHVENRPDYFVHRSREETYPRDAFEATLADPDCLLLGAFDGDRLVGMVRATLLHESGMVKDLRIARLDDIYVVPTHRRQGTGAALLDAAEHWARQQEAVRLDLHVWSFNRDALALYQAQGMTPQRYVLEKAL